MSHKKKINRINVKNPQKYYTERVHYQNRTQF